MSSKRARHTASERGRPPGGRRGAANRLAASRSGTPDSDPRGSASSGADSRRHARTPQRQALRGYFLRFAALSIGFFVLYRVAEVTRLFGHVNEWNAIACGGVLRAARIPHARDGTVLQFGDGALKIISECSAIYVLILFIAAVLAFPASWRARLVGLAVGVPSILALNVLRLATLGVVIRHRADLLPLFHEYLWQVLFVLVVAAFYLVWIERTVRRERPESTA